MPSPTCTVNASSTLNGVNVSAASTITIALSDTAGVNSWSITCIGRDEVASDPTITVDNVTKTATFTSGAAGSAYVFRSVVNGGVDNNGVSQASYTTTFGVYVLTAGGDRVLATGEGAEGSATSGWISQVNTAIRKISGGDATLDDLTLTGDLLIHKDNATPAISQAAKTATASAQAGVGFTWSLQDAVAGTSNAGAAAGGALTVNCGDAARLTSGNANGGGVTWNLGSGIGSGTHGSFRIVSGSGNSDAILRVDNGGGTPLFTVDASAVTISLDTLSMQSVVVGFQADWEVLRVSDQWITDVQGVVSTSDATPTVVVEINPLHDGATSRAGVLHVSGIARRTSDDAIRVFDFKVAFKIDAGVVTLGVQQLLGTSGDIDAAMSTAAMTAVVSGTNIAIQFTGIAATNISAWASVKMSARSW